MLRFAITIFVSAFLLFQIQPIIARYILPWFGGSAAVWTVCLLFFQTTLLAGYSYAHVLRLYLSPSRQASVHLVLLLGAILLLPITPDSSLKPNAGDDPFTGIVILLAITVGIPYLLVSASGPLLQHWFRLNFPQSSPYRLYALSNVGSLLGLLTYPFLIEPLITLRGQTWLWSTGFFVLFILTAACARNFLCKNSALQNFREDASSQTDSVQPKQSQRILWVLLSASASVLLLATTNQVCQDIASVPFLWLLPLSLYLLSFIICFDHAKWYRRRFWLPVWLLSYLFGIYALSLDGKSSILFQIVVYNILLFSACMACHGELVRLKPDPERLTSFYLLIALGGALGGIFVTLIAPRYFTGYWELPLIWCFISVLLGICLFQKPVGGSYRRNLLLQGTWLSACAVLGLVLLSHIDNRGQDVIYVHRNFYGVLRVLEFPKERDTDLGGRSLMHGAILHGNQVTNDEKTRRWPTTYYSGDSGIGLAISTHPKHGRTDREFHIGVIGVGVGTISSLAGEQDNMRFYEINPEVTRISQQYFSFLKDSKANWQVIHGDARISMEQELDSGNAQHFDILVVDAFSSDAIPVHLLTLESFSLYLQHLRDDGILAMHISNRHLDLAPVVSAAARHYDLKAVIIEDAGDESRATQHSRWMLLSNNQEFLNNEDIAPRVIPSGQTIKPTRPWTDNYSNLLAVLIF